MLLDIVSEIIAAESDFTIVGKVDHVAEAAKEICRSRADVVVVQQSSREENVDQEVLLSTWRPVKVIALTNDGHHGFLCDLRPFSVPLGKMSAHGLATAIRSAVIHETS
jgi:AmiR/NasT family two-component response regulator